MRILTLLLLLTTALSAHTVDYQVDQKTAVIVTVRMGEEEASYSEYEVFSPKDQETPYQLGRTDAQGRVAFLPSEVGTWRIKVAADSQHGLHGADIEVKVEQDMTVQLSTRPLVAKHTRLVVGISVLFGLFGLFSLFRAKKSPK